MTGAKKPALVTVGDWYTRHSEALQMRLLGPAVGFERVIREPTINRPGLALSGFYSYFADKRIQVLGSAELSYLKSLPNDEVAKPHPRAAARIAFRAWSSPATRKPAAAPAAGGGGGGSRGFSDPADHDAVHQRRDDRARDRLRTVTSNTAAWWISSASA